MFETIKRVALTKPVLVASVAVFSSALGFAAGYKVAKKKVSEQAREVIDREILETRRFYAKLNEEKKSEILLKNLATQTIPGTKVDQGEFVHIPHTVQQALKDYGHPDPPETILTSVFDSENDHDMTSVPEPKDKDVPYLISSDDFLSNEPEHSQDTITFYEGDDVLADSHDQPINLNAVGDNLGNFGRGTTDSRVMYIRNERLGCDFEVIQHSGSFAQVVHGIGESEQPYRKKQRRSSGDD